MEKGKKIVEGNYNGEIALHVDEPWFSYMRGRIQKASDEMCSLEVRCTIYRVPQNARQFDKRNPYDPMIVSIGPYHRSEERLKAMEEHKWRYLGDFLSRNSKVSLDTYIREIKKTEARARSYYSENISLSSNDFIETMVLDGCFIIEYLIKNFWQPDQLHYMIWIPPVIRRDMLLLENQIPFFVLRRLFDLVGMPNRDFPFPLPMLALLSFPDLLSLNDIRIPETDSIHHFLHLFHSCLERVSKPSYPKRTHSHGWPAKKKKHLLGGVPFKGQKSPSSPLTELLLPQQPSPIYEEKNRFSFSLPSLFAFKKTAESSNKPQPESIPCATNLRHAGIKLEKKDASSFLDIEFHKGVLKIPTLAIYDHTYSLFRNLIAIEQCYPNSKTHITNYAVFLNCIVDGPQDVSLLRKKGIVENGLGSDEELALLFNHLCKDIVVDASSSYLAGVFQDVTTFCDIRWHRWRAGLIRDYFRNPWTLLSLLAAIFLLLLTVAQAIFSVLSYFNPPSHCNSLRFWIDQ